MNRLDFDEGNEQRRLCAGLDGLRDAYSKEEASSSTEERLLLKFREMSSSSRRPLLAWFGWPLAAAAALLVCTLGVWLAFRSTPKPDGQRQATVEPVRTESTTADAHTDRMVSPPKQVPAAVRPHARKHPARSAAGRTVRHVPTPDRAGHPDPDTFIPTMFPIEGDEDYGLQLVRVELPKRTMMSFGFPVDSREMNRPVKADLIIGPDGLTRAIRFVQ